MFQKVRIKIKEKLEAIYQSEIVVEFSNKVDADLAIPLFKLAKTTKTKIQDLAKEIESYLTKIEEIEKTEFLSGFLNIYFDKKQFAEKVIKQILLEKENYPLFPQNKKVVCLDYSSPNIAKNFSVGHLRSTVIGASLSKLYEKAGYKSIGINHLGDWGTQFGKLIVAYNLWGDEKMLDKNAISYLQDLYVRFHDEALNKPELDDEARAVFKKLEKKDEKTFVLWKKFKDLSLVEFLKIYEILGIEFDYFQGESFYNDKMDKVVEMLEDKNLLSLDAGAQIVKLDDDFLPPALIKRADGATLYLTRDLAALIYRRENYHFDKMLYVVGNEQKLHFQQLKLVSSMLGFDFDIEHVNFGLILFEGKKMKSRDGKVIKLQDVIDEAILLAYETIKTKNPHLKNKKQVAKDIGISAVIFNDLKNDRNLDIEFDLQQMLSFEGMTGPYLQYSSVRIYSMLKNQTLKSKQNFALYLDNHYYEVVRQLSQFSFVINKAVKDNNPSVVSKYLLNLARSFNQFYAVHQVIVEDEIIKSTNLSLILAVRIVLNEGMRLLGMKVLNEM